MTTATTTNSARILTNGIHGRNTHTHTYTAATEQKLKRKQKWWISGWASEHKYHAYAHRTCMPYMFHKHRLNFNAEKWLWPISFELFMSWQFFFFWLVLISSPIFQWIQFSVIVSIYLVCSASYRHCQLIVGWFKARSYGHIITKGMLIFVQFK